MDKKHIAVDSKRDREVVEVSDLYQGLGYEYQTASIFGETFMMIDEV